jgi:hypothetical protein
MTLSVGIELTAGSLRAVPLGGPADGPARLAVPPALVVRPSGRLVIGAVGQVSTGGGELYRDFGDRVGDPVPVIGSEGGARFGADLAALTISGLLWQVTRGARANQLVIAHPAGWGRYHTSVLRSALTATWAESVRTRLVSGAVAAATSAERANAIRPGDPVLVADIGDDRTELTLVLGGGDHRRHVGSTVTIDELGATLLDRALAEHIVTQLPERWDATHPAGRSALRGLVALARAARRELIDQPATVVPVRLPSGVDRVRVVRGEFDSLIEEPISCATSAIFRMLREARADGIDVAAVLLTGEPARTPLLAEQLSDHVTVIPPDPEWTIARCAAEMAGAYASAVPIVPATRAPAVPAASTAPRAAGSVRSVDPLAPLPAWADRAAATRVAPRSGARRTARPPAADIGRSRSRFRDAAVSAAAGVALLAAGGVAVGHHAGAPGAHHGHPASYGHGSPRA